MATALFKEGRGLLEAHRAAEACAKFEASYAIEKTVGALLNIGACREQLGQTATAYGAYSDAATLANRLGDAEREAVARRSMAGVEPRLARVKLDVAGANRGAGVVIKRDGKEIPEAAWDSSIPLDPGDHAIDVSAPGKKPWTTTVRIGAAPGTTAVAVPALEADASSGWSGQRLAGVAVAGVGVVGLAVGGVLGGLVLSKTSSLKSEGLCSTDLKVCTGAGLPQRQSAQSMAHGSTAALVIGGAAVVVGGVVFATAPRASAGEPPKSGLRVVVGPVAGAGLTGLRLSGEW